MGQFGNFIVSFCAGCILLGFLYMLCPSGNMSAIVKYVFCLCLVCCTVGASVALSDINFSQFNSLSDAPIINQQNTAAVAQSIFCEALTKQGINFTKVVVYTNKLADNSIVISRVTIFSNEDAQKIYAVIGSDDYEVEVINE